MLFYILSFVETDSWKSYFTWENKWNFALILYIFSSNFDKMWYRGYVQV